MQVKFLKEAVSIVIGNNAESLVDLLYKKKNVSEFLIAKKLDLTVNQTRNILYRLSDQGLVSSTRKKDKRKGWYTYFWSLDVLKSLVFYEEHLNKQIGNLEHQINSRETKMFYICERCQVEYNEENALLHDFTCPECGDIFVVKDNSKVVKEMSRRFEALNKEIEAVRKEVEIEEEKAQKGRDKAHKKVLAEKTAKRKEAAAKRKKAKEITNNLLKKKVGKKNPKKTTKKKTVKKKSVKKKTTVKKPLKKKTSKKKK